MGIGGGAGKILRGIAAKNNGHWIQLIHIDTDKDDQVVDGHIISEIIESEWGSGHGCGGDAVLGENAIRSGLTHIKTRIKNSELLLVVTCLGRGTGSGGVQVISRLVKEENILTFFFVTFPFSFEGNNKSYVAENSLKNLRNGADVVIAIQNDLLFTHLASDKQVSETFKEANELLADGVIGIAELVRCKGLLSVDFPSLKSVLSRKEAFCSIGIGKAEGNNKILNVIDSLFQSSMLGGRDFVDKADVIIATLIGGENMSIGEMQQCLSKLNNHLNSVTKTIIGAAIVPDQGDEIKISMLAIQFLRSNAKIKIEGGQPGKQQLGIKKRGKRNVSSENSPHQLTLPFGDERHTLGIFADCSPTIYQGQNLDIPTFQRLCINLDLSEE